jgi:hypothetical protein
MVHDLPLFFRGMDQPVPDFPTALRTKRDLLSQVTSIRFVNRHPVCVYSRDVLRDGWDGCGNDNNAGQAWALKCAMTKIQVITSTLRAIAKTFPNASPLARLEKAFIETDCLDMWSFLETHAMNPLQQDALDKTKELFGQFVLDAHPRAICLRALFGPLTPGEGHVKDRTCHPKMIVTAHLDEGLLPPFILWGADNRAICHPGTTNPETDTTGLVVMSLHVGLKSLRERHCKNAKALLRATKMTFYGAFRSVIDEYDIDGQLEEMLFNRTLEGFTGTLRTMEDEYDGLDMMEEIRNESILEEVLHDSDNAWGNTLKFRLGRDSPACPACGRI